MLVGETSHKWTGIVNASRIETDDVEVLYQVRNVRPTSAKHAYSCSIRISIRFSGEYGPEVEACFEDLAYPRAPWTACET